jgi:hypothetical protein
MLFGKGEGKNNTFSKSKLYNFFLSYYISVYRPTGLVYILLATLSVVQVIQRQTVAQLMNIVLGDM